MNKLKHLCFTLCLLISTEINAASFTLASSAAADGNKLPVLYTCDGSNVSPPLAWQNVPANTKAFALTLADPDAPSGVFYHWVVYNMAASTSELAEGIKALPEGGLAGANAWGKAEYDGPCPPAGSTHHYIFTVYALDASLSLPAGADHDALDTAMKGHVLGQATLTTLYARSSK